jgi:hypothetical protein
LALLNVSLNLLSSTLFNSKSARHVFLRLNQGIFKFGENLLQLVPVQQRRCRNSAVARPWPGGIRFFSRCHVDVQLGDLQGAIALAGLVNAILSSSAELGIHECITACSRHHATHHIPYRGHIELEWVEELLYHSGCQRHLGERLCGAWVGVYLGLFMECFGGISSVLSGYVYVCSIRY